MKIKGRPGVGKDLELKYENDSRKGKILSVALLIVISGGFSMFQTHTT